MIMMPEPIQLRRTKGWRLPANTVVVSRPSIWGNPFDWQEAQREWGGTELEAKAAVVQIYRDWLNMEEPERFGAQLRPRRVTILANLSGLRGSNLACWCGLPDPGEPDHCHRSVLLEMANR